jgi:hypothetical protein
MNQLIGVVQDIKNLYSPLLLDKEYKDKLKNVY